MHNQTETQMYTTPHRNKISLALNQATTFNTILLSN